MDNNLHEHIHYDVPEDLDDILSGSVVSRNNKGHSDAEVFLIKNLNQFERAYLKVMPYSDSENLEKEATVLAWLAGKLPVPKTYYYRKFKGKEFLLISEIDGADASNSAIIEEPEELVKAYALGLKQIHAVDIFDCPCDQTLKTKIEVATSNVGNGLVDETDFEPQYQGRSASELLELVLGNIPAEEDLVFTHGDYSLDNVILKENKVAGFIDLGRAGIADRYQDIALALRTVKSIYGSGRWSERFLEHYGLENLDSSKVDFYILLDELF